MITMLSSRDVYALKALLPAVIPRETDPSIYRSWGHVTDMRMTFADKTWNMCVLYRFYHCSFHVLYLFLLTCHLSIDY